MSNCVVNNWPLGHVTASQVSSSIYDTLILVYSRKKIIDHLLL